jgi:hypothetical protein
VCQEEITGGGHARRLVPYLHEGQSMAEDDLIDAFQGKISHFKIPKKVFFVNHFPRNSNSPIQASVMKRRTPLSPRSFK